MRKTDTQTSRFRMPGFGRDRRGTAAVEFAMLAAPFFACLMAILETGSLYASELMLDRAVERLARSIQVGDIQKSAMTEAQFRTRICADVAVLMRCDRLHIDVSTYADFSSIPVVPPLTNGAINATGFKFVLSDQETITTLRVFYEWSVATDVIRRNFANMANGSYLISSVAAFKTEPYK